jgi:mono/diheme cytochrome c family protein
LAQFGREEITMLMKRFTLIFAVLFIFTCAGFAQNQTPTQSDKVIKHVPAKETSAASGKEMFKSYCAVCHGAEGKGNGPAASALKTAPVDLTTLSKNNGGKYPSLKVSSAIRGDSAVSAHGTKEMPVWGPLFWDMSKGHEGEVQQRVTNLTKYIESLQAK